MSTVLGTGGFLLVWVGGVPREKGRPPRPPLHLSGGVPASAPSRYSSMGAMMPANLFRARFSRDFTVPSVTPVISEISS